MKKIILSITAILCALLILMGAAHSPIVNWGLGVNTLEQTPTPPSYGKALLDEYNGLFVSNKNAAEKEKKVYFTFDLGYEAGHTAKVLDILKEHSIKGVFFLCGAYLDQNALIERMIAEGHTIGNHTDKHKDLPTLSDDAIKTDIASLNEKFTEKYPGQKTMSFFRPPKGRFDAHTLKIAKEQGLRAMLWSVAIVDWSKTPIDAKACANKITSRIHPGAIVLFHITNSGTPEMLKLLIPQLMEKGYSVGNPTEL